MILDKKQDPVIRHFKLYRLVEAVEVAVVAEEAAVPLLSILQSLILKLKTLGARAQKLHG